VCDNHVEGELDLRSNEARCQVGPINLRLNHDGHQRRGDSPEISVQRFETTPHKSVSAKANSLFTLVGTARAQKA
jgi:hypothetical protein